MNCNTQYKDAVRTFLEQTDAIKRLAADYPDDLTFVTTAQGKQTKVLCEVYEVCPL